MGIVTLAVSSQALAEQLKRAFRRIRYPLNVRFRVSGKAPERLALAPQDLKTPDPAAAAEIYAGRFFLAGHNVDTTGRNPFTIRQAPAVWQRELNGFEWLRHLEADGTALARNNAIALLTDWMDVNPRPRPGPAWEEIVVARRLMAWIWHSIPIVETASPEFYSRWMKAIGTNIAFLRHRYPILERGTASLLTAAALTYAGVCIDGQKPLLNRSAKRLDAELHHQIREDGTHLDRSPKTIVELLAVLLPLRVAFSRLGIQPPNSLSVSTDRMLAAVKFFRLGDGNLARFNGMASARPELLSTIMYFDEAIEAAPDVLFNAGYDRLELGKTIVICDTGSTPPRQFSENTNAGTLSFEMSSGSNLMVINAGWPDRKDTGLKQLARSTAAHSTATVNDTSSVRFYQGNGYASVLADKVVSPRLITLRKRTSELSFKQVSASHNGYQKPFGLIHQRDLRLSDGGQRLEGIDRFEARRTGFFAKAKALEFVIRFHLHPSVSAGLSTDRKSIILMLGGGDSWQFACREIAPEIEESILFASNSGPKRTRQIVIKGNVSDFSQVAWRFQQLPT